LPEKADTLFGLGAVETEKAVSYGRGLRQLIAAEIFQHYRIRREGSAWIRKFEC
jgi:hypothetical protein